MAKLSAGDKAPTFELESTQGTQDLKAYAGDWVVLYFYPKDDTPGCTKEACEFRDALPGLGAHVVGVSADDLTSHGKFEAKYSLPFPLAADEDATVAKAYGAYGEKSFGGKTYEGVLRATFIVDPEGDVAEAMYDVKAEGHADAVRQKLLDLKA